MDNRPALIDGSPRSASGSRFQPQGVSARGGARRAAAECDVNVTLPARAENVVLVRSLVGALAEFVGLEPFRVDDIRLAVTEACTNVVRHAYAAGTGPLAVAARLRDGQLSVVVTDTGRGLRPRLDAPEPGLGLPLMAAVATSFAVDHPHAGGGTRVQMSFALGE